MGLKCIGVDLHGLKCVCSVDEWVCTVWSGSVLFNVGLQSQRSGSVQTKVGVARLKVGLQCREVGLYCL